MDVVGHAAWPSIGTPVEGEWIPDRWHVGIVSEVDAHGRYTICYDDGYVQRNVESHRLRPVARESLGDIAVTCQSRTSDRRFGDTDVISEEMRSATQQLCQQLWSAATVWQHTSEQVEPKLEEFNRREELVAAEAEELRNGVDKLVEEAVASGDWWKLQAATQILVGAGFGDEKVAPLRKAMCKSRQPATDTANGATEVTQHGSASAKHCSGCCFASTASGSWCKDEAAWTFSGRSSSKTSRALSGPDSDAVFFSGGVETELLQERFNLLEEAERLEGEGSLERYSVEDITQQWQAVSIDSPHAIITSKWGCRGLHPLERCS